MLAWLMRSIADANWSFRRGRMFAPLAIFSFFVAAGYVRGIAAGGDKRIAVFEGRPMFYMIIVYLLVTNLLSTRRQYVTLVMTAMVAVAIQSVFSLQYYRGLPAFEKENIESLGEHSAMVAMNALFILCIAAWCLRCSRWLRWSTTLLVIPVVWAYLLSQ